MNLSILLSAAAAVPATLEGKSVVVIDVLRATSVIVTALENGATAVLPVAAVEEAFRLIEPNRILGGERHAEKVEGFDLGNSPIEYTRSVIEGREVVLTTTNGTRALSRCPLASRVWIGSFLNAAAVASRMNEIDTDWVLLCSGTNGEFSLDDFLCAGLIASRLDRGKYPQNDLVSLAISTWARSSGNLREALKECRHYGILNAKGFHQDLDFCLRTDVCQTIPRFRDGRIFIAAE